MNMSEKVGRVGRGLWRVNLLSRSRGNFWESNVLPDNFFHDQKRNMTLSVTWSKRVECFSSFLKYLFCNKLARFCCFSQQFFTLYCLSKRKLSQKFKSCVNWLLLRVKIKKQTFSWDVCEILFQLNCLFAEIYVQRLLIKENFEN